MSETTFHALFRQLMAAYRANDYTRALALAEKASERGSDSRLLLSSRSTRKEPDLVSLRDVAAFRELLEVNNQRFAEIQAHARPELLVIPAAQQATIYPLLTALHGNTSNARDTSTYWAEITAQGWLLALSQP